MAKNRITFFAVDNGDAVLLEAHGYTIMTDIKYRAACADEDNNEVNDFGPIIRTACDHDRMDIFVLTHPDEDHLLGFGEIFHLGDPTDRDDDPEDDVKLIVDEIWCSEYGANPNYTTSVSKPLLDEIKRRKKLIGTAAGDKAGNRLKILTATDAAEEEITSGLTWRLLAPDENEADIPKAKEDEPNTSSNPSSLVIQWSVTVGGKTSKVVLGGDSTAAVWERINNDYSALQKEWNVLLAPHHCSHDPMGRHELKDGEDNFVWSNDAIAGLDNPRGLSPYVVSSSRKFGSKTPPNPKARERYYKILAKGGEINDAVKNRFLVTAGKHGEDADDVVFNFTSSGVTKSIVGTSAAVISSPASSGGGSYGAA